MICWIFGHKWDKVNAVVCSAKDIELVYKHRICSRCMEKQIEFPRTTDGFTTVNAWWGSVNSFNDRNYSTFDPDEWATRVAAKNNPGFTQSGRVPFDITRGVQVFIPDDEKPKLKIYRSIDDPWSEDEHR